MCWDSRSARAIESIVHLPILSLPGSAPGGVNLLMSSRECVGLTRLRLRTYSKHLTAASWKLWCRLASTVSTELSDVSMNMACS